MKYFAFWLGIVCWVGGQASAQDLTDPNVILTKSREAYENCTTCVVEGRLRSQIKAIIPRSEVKDMRLIFSRLGDLFRLDWSEEKLVGGGRKTNSVFTRDGKTCFYWGSRNRLQIPEDRMIALAGATGISSGLAYFLPMLLLHQGNTLAVQAPTLRPEETFNDRPCYVIAGTVRQGDSPFEVAIDKKTFAVVRVKETDHIRSRGNEEAIAMLKKSNPDLAAKMAALPPTPDFDVDTITDYTTTFGTLITTQDCDYPVPAGMQPTEGF